MHLFLISLTLSSPFQGRAGPEATGGVHRRGAVPGHPPNRDAELHYKQTPRPRLQDDSGVWEGQGRNGAFDMYSNVHCLVMGGYPWGVVLVFEVDVFLIRPASWAASGLGGSVDGVSA